jgi:hypothetical protein
MQYLSSPMGKRHECGGMRVEERKIKGGGQRA